MSGTIDKKEVISDAVLHEKQVRERARTQAREQVRTQKQILVLSGGSVKGIAHIGALKALEDNMILQNIKIFAGASIGGMIAALYIIGYSPTELMELVELIDLEIFINLKINNILDILGLDDCVRFTTAIKKMIVAKNFDENITFLDLYNKTNKQLILTTTCVNEKKTHYISHETYPDLPLIIGIRMTTSLPLIFAPVSYNNKLFIDGGLMNNYPINIFQKKINKVIGIYLDEKREYCENINTIESYLLNTIDCIFEGFTILSTEKYIKQTIKISFQRLGVFNFNISLDKKQLLYETGYKDAENYIMSNM